MLSQIARHNGTQMPNTPLAAPPAATGPPATLLDTFRAPELRRRMSVMMVCWFVVSLAYYGVSLALEALDGSLYLNFFLISLIEYPSYFVTIAVCPSASPTAGHDMSRCAARRRAVRCLLTFCWLLPCCKRPGCCTLSCHVPCCALPCCGLPFRPGAASATPCDVARPRSMLYEHPRTRACWQTMACMLCCRSPTTMLRRCTPARPRLARNPRRTRITGCCAAWSTPSAAASWVVLYCGLRVQRQQRCHPRMRNPATARSPPRTAPSPPPPTHLPAPGLALRPADTPRRCS